MPLLKNAFKRSLIAAAITTASANALAVDFGVPADDNPLVPGIDANVMLTEISTGYTVPGDIFDITAPPNDAGTLNGIQYGPVAFGGVPGGAIGWVNSSYVIPNDGYYGLAFWVSDVNDTVVNSALAIDNVQLPGLSITEFDNIPAGWQIFGSSGFSTGTPNVLPTIGDTFGFIDTQNDFLGEVSTDSGGVNTSFFGGTIGSVALTAGFEAASGNLISFDANFFSNDGANYNDFALVQLFDWNSLTLSTEAPAPSSVPPDALLAFSFEYLVFNGIIDAASSADVTAFDDFMFSISELDAQTALESLLSEYGINETDLTEFTLSSFDGEIPTEIGTGAEITTIEYDFANAITLYTADSSDPLTGLDPEIPILPDNDPNPGNGIWEFVDIEVVPEVVWWFDPEYATGYDYTVTGSNFASITLPLLGDDCYDLIVNGVVEHECAAGTGLLGGVEHDLSDFTDLTSLTVKGIEVDEQLNPNDPNAFVTGFKFTDPGVVTVTQAPLTTFVPDPTNVPEPGTLFLMGSGIIGFVGYRRKYRKA